MNIKSFLDSLERGGDPRLPPSPHSSDARLWDDDVEGIQGKDELYIDRKGRVRQAGAEPTASSIEARTITNLRRGCERNLFLFSKAILKKWWLHQPLHLPFCQFLTTFDHGKRKKRKGGLMPREHAKTSIVSHSLPIHILIQPKENNLYAPGMDGTDMRILLSGETLQRATDHIQHIEGQFESNELLRALWPHKVWPTRSAQRKVKWNDIEMTVPREGRYPDPSIRGLGANAATTGSHPNVLIKDDIIAFKAANSASEMQKAIEWHKASRALVAAQGNHLEFIIGTRWAVADLYSYIIHADKSVEWYIRAALETDGKPDLKGEAIYPVQGSNEEGEPIGFVKEDLIDMRENSLGHALFSLLYMNDARDASLTDFKEPREYELNDDGSALTFREDERDFKFAAGEAFTTDPRFDMLRGTPLSQAFMQKLALENIRKISVA